MTSDDLLMALGIDRPLVRSATLEEIASSDLRYRDPTPDEFEEYVLDTLKLIDRPFISRSKAENLAAFEKGWLENFDLLSRVGVSEETIKPRYFRPSKFLRYDKRLVVTPNLDLQYDLFAVSRDLVFEKYLSESSHICEIGCGSCQNLYALANFFPHTRIEGMDWTDASGKIAHLLSNVAHRTIDYHRFDMTAPDRSVAIDHGCAIVTIHAMEQIGSSFESFLTWIIEQRPSLVVNWEPVLEFYDENNLLDYLALTYCKRRNYLNGYLTKLRELRDRGMIDILDERRPYLGGVVHEASVVVWRPR